MANRTKGDERRSATTHRAILDATFAVLVSDGLHALTVEGVAARAGVAKQTIYRWWPSKIWLAVEAVTDNVRTDVDVPDTGDIVADLTAVLTASAALMTDPRLGPVITELFGSWATTDNAEPLDTVLFGPVRRRNLDRLATARTAGQLPDGVSDDDIIDRAFGPLWFRLVNRAQPVTEQFARDCALAALHQVDAPGSVRARQRNPSPRRTRNRS